MATYEKIDANTFVEITENREKIRKKDLVAQRENLKEAYQSLVEPTHAEKIAFAESNHPYYVQRQLLYDQWQATKDLIEYLNSL
jgi:hypothetical protein